MDIQDIRQTLFSLGEDDYKRFMSSLLPNIHPDTIIGVRLPVLRKIAKRIARGDYLAYLDTCKRDYYEEKMIEGFVIGMADMTFDERCGCIARFVSCIDNWGICDSFCACLKFARENREEVWKQIMPYFVSHHPYEVRFAVVMAIFYFASEEYIDDFFERISLITADDYYVKMAIAWAISVCYVECPARTKEYLMHCDKTSWIYRKALTKIIESKRVSDIDKAWIRECRSKIKNNIVSRETIW